MNDQESSVDPTQESPEKGGCLRRGLKRGCGCGALALGALLVLIWFLPALAGGFVADEIEREFGSQQAGHLEIPSPDLSWTSSQAVEGVRLYDPEGRLVATATLDFPSIGDLLEVASRFNGGGVIDLGRYELTLEADVVVDEEGRSNLEAALASNRPRSAEIDVESDPRPSGDPGNSKVQDLLRRLQVAIDVTCPRLTWSDPRLDVADHRVALHDVRGELLWRQGGLVTLGLEGRQECETGGPFQLDATMAGWQLDGGEVLPAEWNASLSAAGLSGALVDRLGQLEGEVGTLLGDSFSVEGAVTGSLLALEQASVKVQSEALLLALTGKLVEERFQLLPDASVLEIEPGLAGERLAAWSARVLPEGMALVLPDAGLLLELRQLVLDVPLLAEDPMLDSRVSIEVALGSLGVRDPFQKGSEEELVLDGLELSLGFAPGDPLRLQASTSFADQSGSRLEIDLLLEERWAEKVVAGDETPEADLRIEAEGIPIERLRRLALVPEAIEEFCGGRLDVTATGRAVDGRLAPFRLVAHTEILDLVLEGEADADRATLKGEGLSAQLRLPEKVVAELAREYLPEGRLLSAAKQELPVRFEIAQLDLDLAGMGGEKPLGATIFAGTLQLGAVNYTESALADTGQQISLEGGELRYRLTRKGALSLDLTAKLEGEEGGTLQAELKSSDGARLLVGEALEEQVIVFKAEATGFPTRVIDAYAEQNGLLVDVLGSRVEAYVASSAFSLQGGVLILNASSALGTFHWRGHYEDGALVSGEGGRLNASVGLSPLLGERIVGPLVPLLVDLKKPGQEPVILKASSFNLPLDGDFTKLDARLRLELGQVTCSLLPGLASELSGLIAKQVQDTNIPPIVLTIEKGVVRYNRLPIRVDGRPMNLKGSYDLSSGAFNFSTDVRLGDLGGDAGRALREVKRVLGDDYLVPVRLGGTKKSPKLSLKSGFLEQAVQDAGVKALEKELKDQLGEDLGKALKDLLGGGG